MDDTNSTDWLDSTTITNRSVVLQLHTATSGGSSSGNNNNCLLMETLDPWNHPLMMDCCDEDDDDDYEAYPGTTTASSVKRVSLDVTETTWMTSQDEEDDGVFAFMEGLETDPIVLASSAALALSQQQGATTQLFHNTMEVEDHPWNGSALLLHNNDDDHHNDDDTMILMDEQHCCTTTTMEQGDGTGTTATTTTTTDSTTTTTGEYACTANGVPVPWVNTTKGVVTSFSRQFHERRALLAASMRASQLSRQCLSMKEHVQHRTNLQQVLADIEKSTVAVQEQIILVVPTSTATVTAAQSIESSNEASTEQQHDDEALTAAVGSSTSPLQQQQQPHDTTTTMMKQATTTTNAETAVSVVEAV
jgi:hypothetical protein